MGRRRKANDRKPARKPHWTFGQLMPKMGFNFGERDCFLRHVEKSRVRSSLKVFTRTMNRNQIDEALSILAQAGVDFVDHVGTVQHITFWDGISRNVEWSASLSGEKVFTLIVVLLRAHEEFERNLPDYFHPSRYGRTAKAIHEFAKLLKEKYADNPEIMNLYFSPLPTLDDEGSDTDVSVPIPEELTEEEIQAEPSWQNPFEYHHKDYDYMNDSRDDTEDEDEVSDDDGYPNPYRPKTKPHGASKFEKAFLPVIGVVDKKEEDDVDEEMYRLQIQSIADTCVRQGREPPSGTGHKLEVEIFQAASERIREGGPQAQAQPE